MSDNFVYRFESPMRVLRDAKINKVLLKIIKYRQTNKTVISRREELIFRRFELPIERTSRKIAMLAL